MTDLPLVSIIVPAWNAGRWLPETINSVLAQRHAHWELIIVDDGSKDDTRDIAMAVNDHRVHLICQDNGGAARARNRGLAAARGAFIQYLDADDLLDSDKIQVQLAAFDASRPTLVFSGRWRRFLRSQDQFIESGSAFARDLSATEFLQRSLRDNEMMHPAAWLVPRSIVDQAGPWQEKISVNDDGEYFARVLGCAGGIRFVPSALSWYRSNLIGSLSGRSGQSSAESQIRALESISTELLRLDASAPSQRAVKRAHARLAMALWPAHPELSARLSSDLTPADLREAWQERPRSFQILAPWFGWRTARHIEDLVAALRRIGSRSNVPAPWRDRLSG